MDKPSDSSIVVLGAGIVGICTALALQDEAFNVTLIDRSEPGQGTSKGNAGVVSPFSCVPMAMPGVWKSIPGLLMNPHGAASVSKRHLLGYLPWFSQFLKQSNYAQACKNSAAMFLLSANTNSQYRSLLAGTGHENLIQDSLQIHAFKQKENADINALGYRLRIDNGAEVWYVDDAEMHRLEPALSTEYQAGIVLGGLSRCINPGKVGQVLAEKFQRNGGSFLCANAKALNKKDHAWSIDLGDKTIEASRVVVSAGAWSGELLSRIGVQVPLAVERGYHVSYPTSGISLNHSVMDVEGHVIASSMETGLRVAGIAEFSDTIKPVNPKRVETVRRAAVSMFPELEHQHFESWMGYRPSFPDSLPIIEQLSGHAGLYAAFGHSHFGLLMAPKTGRIVADLVSNRKHNIDLSVFSAQRFNQSGRITK